MPGPAAVTVKSTLPAVISSALGVYIGLTKVASSKEPVKS